MKRSRVSIAMLMVAVAAVAVDLAVIRAYQPGTPDDLLYILFATGVMPVASLLILVGSIAAPRLLRRGEISSFVIGFEASGWAAVFAFIAGYSIASTSILNHLDAMAKLILPVFIAYPTNSPSASVQFAELGFLVILFSFPQLLIALLGGWLARRSGVTVRFTLVDSSHEQATEVVSEDAIYSQDSTTWRT